jgi:GDP-mannose transporter
MADDKRKDDYVIEMGDRDDDRFKEPPTPRAYSAPAPSRRSIMNHPMTPILSYCASSILMTVLNKYVLSEGFKLNFFLLGVQVSLIDGADIQTLISCRVLFVFYLFRPVRLWDSSSFGISIRMKQRSVSRNNMIKNIL